MNFFESIKSKELREIYASKNKAGLDHYRDYLLSDEYLADIELLERGEYMIEPPELVFVPKLEGGLRKTHRYDVKSNALLGMINLGLQKYDGLFTKSCYSHVKGGGIRTMLQAIRNNNERRDCYVCKFDVCKFGDFVDRDLLNQDVDELINDDVELNRFLHSFINDKRSFYNGELTCDATATHQGSPITQFLNDLYLIQFDKEIEKRTIAYYRYRDDIIAYVGSEEEADSLRAFVEEFMKKKKMEINQEKCMLAKPGESYKLFGCTIGPNSIEHTDAIKLYKQIINHKKIKALKIRKKYELSSQEAMAWYIKSLYLDKKGSLMEVCRQLDDIELLKYIDSLIQDALRQIGSGKRTGAKYRIRYEDMKRAGYYSLVHEYYESIVAR